MRQSRRKDPALTLPALGKFHLPSWFRSSPPPKPPKPPTSIDATLRDQWKQWKEHPGDSFTDFLCWNWLTSYAHLVEGVGFIYHGRFTGDFYFPGKHLSWLIRGTTFKPTPSVAYTMAQMQQRGITLVQLKASDVEQRTAYVLRQAYLGIQVK